MRFVRLSHIYFDKFCGPFNESYFTPLPLLLSIFSSCLLALRYKQCPLHSVIQHSESTFFT